MRRWIAFFSAGEQLKGDVSIWTEFCWLVALDDDSFPREKLIKIK
jgi:hypothetical protein